MPWLALRPDSEVGLFSTVYLPGQAHKEGSSQRILVSRSQQEQGQALLDAVSSVASASQRRSMRRAEEQVSGDGSGTQVSDSGDGVGTLGADKTWGTVVALGEQMGHGGQWWDLEGRLRGWWWDSGDRELATGEQLRHVCCRGGCRRQGELFPEVWEPGAVSGEAELLGYETRAVITVASRQMHPLRPSRLCRDGNRRW